MRASGRASPATISASEEMRMLSRASHIVEAGLSNSTAGHHGFTADIIMALAAQGHNPIMAIARAIQRGRARASSSEDDSSEEDEEDTGSSSESAEEAPRKIQQRKPRISTTKGKADSGSASYRSPVDWEGNLRSSASPAMRRGGKTPSPVGRRRTAEVSSPLLSSHRIHTNGSNNTNNTVNKAGIASRRPELHSRVSSKGGFDSPASSPLSKPPISAVSRHDSTVSSGFDTLPNTPKSPSNMSTSSTHSKDATSPRAGAASSTLGREPRSPSAAIPLVMKLSSGDANCRVKCAVTSIEQLTLEEVRKAAMTRLLTSCTDPASIRVEYVDSDGDRVRCTVDDDLALAPIKAAAEHVEVTFSVSIPPAIITAERHQDGGKCEDEALGTRASGDCSPAMRSRAGSDLDPSQDVDPELRRLKRSSSAASYNSSARASSMLGMNGRIVRDAVRGGFLGAGSFGRVFAGIDVDTGTPIAMKEVNINLPASVVSVMQSPQASPLKSAGRSRVEDIAESSESIHSGESLPPSVQDLERLCRLDPGLRALQREILLLSSLDHENIIRYMGMTFAESSSAARSYLPGRRGNRGGSAAIVIYMEQATSGSLKKTIDEYGALPEPLLARYARDMLRGLSYLHSKNILHRDIKPANVLMSNGVAKLADFGCSKLQPVAVTDSGVSGSGDDTKLGMHDQTMAGTLAYMAPEVLTAAIELSQDDEPGRHHRRGRRNRQRATPRHGSPSPSSVSSTDSHGDAGAKAMPPRRDRDVMLKGVYGWASDIWAVGITCLEMAAGKSLFSAGWPAVLKVVMEKRAPEVPAHLSPEARDFLTKCLAFMPADRWNADQLLLHPFLLSLDTLEMAEESFETTQSTISTIASTLSSTMRSIESSSKAPLPSTGAGTLHSWSISTFGQPAPAGSAESVLGSHRPISALSSVSSECPPCTPQKDDVLFDETIDHMSIPQTATWQREHLAKLRSEVSKVTGIN